MSYCFGNRVLHDIASNCHADAWFATWMPVSIIEYSPTTTTTLDVHFIASRQAPAMAAAATTVSIYSVCVFPWYLTLLRAISVIIAYKQELAHVVVWTNKVTCIMKFVLLLYASILFVGVKM